MNLRKFHTIIGLTLLIPFLLWIVTAMVFYFKPGYANAYEFLQVKTYPLNQPLAVVPDSGWTEIRYVRTILGSHLLAHTAEGWKNLDPTTGKPRPEPSKAELGTLLMDAFTANPSRYGQISSISHDTIRTSTNILIVLDWSRLGLEQRGPDTERIDLLYKIHYLQWTGNRALDKILGPVGLGLVLILSVVGVVLAFGKKR